jgi:hypothetical protein
MTASGAVCPLTIIAWRLSALPVRELWERYIELGGNRPRAAITEYFAGTAAWGASEHNVLVHALTECLWDLGCPSLAPYRELAHDRPAVSPEIE